MNFPLDLRVPDRKSQAAVFYISHSGRVVLVGWVSAVLCDFKVTPKAPPGGILPYITHIGMFRPKWYGYGLFRSLNEYTLCPFWSGIGYGFRENYGSVRTYLPLQFQIYKKEIEICELEMLFKTFFVCALI